MSQGGLVYKSLSLMISFDQAIRQAWLKFLATLAEAQPQIVQSFLDTAKAAASQAGEAIRGEMIGSITAAAAGFACVLVSVGALSLSTSKQDTSELEQARKLETKLNEEPTQATSEITEEARSPHDQAIKQLTSTNAARIDLSKEGNQRNLDAVDVMTTEQRALAAKNVNSRIETLQKSMDQGYTKANSRIQMATQLSNATSAAGEAGGKAKAADATEVSQTEQAQQQAISTVSQRVDTQIQNAQQTADAFASEAMSVAANMAHLN